MHRYLIEYEEYAGEGYWPATHLFLASDDEAATAAFKEFKRDREQYNDCLTAVKADVGVLKRIEGNQLIEIPV